MNSGERYRALSLQYASGETSGVTMDRYTAGRIARLEAKQRKKGWNKDRARLIDRVKEFSGAPRRPNRKKKTTQRSGQEFEARFRVERPMLQPPRAAFQAWKHNLVDAMRNHPTNSEALVTPTLKTLGFRQQAEILGYIADFAHFGKRVIVEIDGGIHQRADVYEKDRKRNEVLRAHGWIVLHFTDTQVYSDAEQVYASIKAAIGDYAVNTEALAA